MRVVVGRWCRVRAERERWWWKVANELTSVSRETMKQLGDGKMVIKWLTRKTTRHQMMRFSCHQTNELANNEREG